MHKNGVTGVLRAAVWGLAGLVVLGVLLVGVSAATLPGCGACHQAKTFVAQSRSSRHAQVACIRCHVAPGVTPRIAYGYRVIFGMTLRLTGPASGSAAVVSNAACLSCHEAVMKNVVSNNGLSIRHADCSRGRLCTDCHSETAHGSSVRWVKTVQMNQCLDCHSAQKVQSACEVCHSGRSAQQRLQSGEWSVTHGPNWKQTHGMGDVKTCTSCHPGNYCVKCHGLAMPHDSDFIRNHPSQALSQRKDCNVCHNQAFCDDCHGLAMPHPASFTPAHSGIVKKNGSATCMRCHVQDDCDTCHVRHIHPGGATTAPSGGAR